MITEFVQVGEHAARGSVLDALVMNAEDSDDHFSRYVYVLSPLGRLVGVAAASELAAVPRASCRRRHGASTVHRGLDRAR